MEAQLAAINAEVDNLERGILAQHQENDPPATGHYQGIGPINASAMAASAPAPSLLLSGSQFAAWPGLRLRTNRCGGKEGLGGIRKMGDLPRVSGRGKAALRSTSAGLISMAAVGGVCATRQRG